MPRIDRNERARLLFRAETLDRRTHQPGQHGGCLKHSGLRVLRALLFHFANAVTGRCDPGYDVLARAAGVARSTVAMALHRLEAAGLIVRTRRQVGMVRLTNAYAFKASETAWSENRLQTTNKTFESLRVYSPPLAAITRKRHQNTPPLAAGIVYQPKSAKTGPTDERVRALLGALERRERCLGLAPVTG